MKKIVVIDGNSLLFKAYYASAYTGNLMQTSDGLYTNALYSFINMINKIQRDFTYDYFLVAFDASKNNFRYEKYEAYKGTRNKTPEELIMQFGFVREYLNVMNIPNYEVDNYEADDIIGTIATINKDIKVDIISSDKDLFQLIDNHVDVIVPVKGVSEIKVVTKDNLNEIWDITPKQVIDLKALMGDPSDNIPGVKGVGEKTAIKLIQEYQTLDNIYQNIGSIKGKLKEKLETDKENAYLSYDLATIVTDMNLPFNIEDLVIQPSDDTKVKEFYHRYELNSLLNNMSVKKNEDVIEYEIVSDLSNDQLIDYSYVELVSLNENYHMDCLLGISIINETGNYFIKPIDLIKSNNILEFLKANNNKLGYDIKRNIVLGYWNQLEINGYVEDSLISTYLIDCNLKLDANVLVDSKYHVSTIDNNKLLKEELDVIIDHKIRQGYYLRKLIEDNKSLLKQLGLEELYQIELKTAYCLAKMEINGILVDQNLINEISIDATKQLEMHEKAIYELANKEFNINSTKELGDVLFVDLNLPVIKKTKTGYSTDIDVLEKLLHSHPIINQIISYRKLKKLLSTYILPLPNFILSDNRIHTIYNQCQTTTGRLSSKMPSLQNIGSKTSENDLIKKVFISKDNYSLLSFDYSQIELRLLAAFSNDEIFIKAFNNYEDIHAQTAALVNGIQLSDVSSEQRKQAKAINFGIVYGMSDFGLASQLNITRQEAKEFIEKYYESYPSIHDYLNSLVDLCLEKGHTRTLFNRLRNVSEIKSNNFNIRESGKRMAMNTPLQGSAADILKVAMNKIDEEFKKHDYDIKMLLQVHDELIFEVKDDQIEACTKIISDIMTNVVDLSVKLEVSQNSAKNWALLK